MDTLNKTKRNYGIDLLRITAMYLIVLLHVLLKGGILLNLTAGSTGYSLAWLLEVCAFCAVNCYGIISGYVGLNSNFKYSNIALLWLRVLFYSVGITAVFAIIMPETLTEVSDDKIYFISKYWDRALLPVSERQYWYFTSYFLCYFFTPILNKAVHTLERKQLKAAIIAILLILCIPTLYTGKDVFNISYGYSAFWLLTLYIIGAYMKKYNSLSRLGKTQAFAGYIASAMITWASKISLISYFPKFTRSDLLVSYTSPTIIASAIFLFVLFKNINPPKAMCKVIGFLTPLSFSVYLIHTHPLIFENIINALFYPLTAFSVPIMLLSIIAVAFGLYLTCSAIDIIRHYLFKLLRLQKLLMLVEEKIKNKFLRNEKN